MQARKPNIVITGFMGTGKTTVGREVARRLNREFYDTDQIVEAQAGMTIAEIFDRYGEAHFREIERGVIEGLLAGKSGVVISTGGGTLLSPLDKRLMDSGIVFCLSAGVEVLEQRMCTSMSRPLLQAREAGVNIRALLKRRENQYKRFSHQIDTSDLSPEQAASELIRIYMEAI
jgi:shikimate kinase